MTKEDDWKALYLAEVKRRESIERKYIATLVRIDKFYTEAKNIMGKSKRRNTATVGF